MDYLGFSKRLYILNTDRPLWIRHDHSALQSKQLTSHAFVKNLKKYARLAGLKHIHLHQTRHSFARIVAEQTGSFAETQDALNHRNLSTTRAYIQGIILKRDKYSKNISDRLGW